jgi:hypothetical protein
MMSDRGVYPERTGVSGTSRSGRESVRREMNAIAARQSLGEALLVSISKHGHTDDDAAALMGTARANVYQWANDLIDPWPENFDALTAYLGVALDTLGVLIIHSQMRRAQLRSQRARTGRDANAIGR